MTVLLRPYQEKIIGDVRTALRLHKRVLLQLATGGGKTVCAAFMAGNAAAKRLRVGFACHRDFLIDQTSKTFDLAGIKHTFVAAGRHFHPHMPVVIYSIDTLRRRLDNLPPPDIMILDESQHASAATWSKVVEWMRGGYIIGLSATPARLDGNGLDKHFDIMVRGPTVRWLMDNGHLSGYRVFASPVLADLSGVKNVAGDYNQGQLAEAVDKDVLVGDLVKHYRMAANGLRAMYFAVSIEHSKHIVESFNASGVPTAHMDGSTPSSERANIARSIARGTILVVVNCQIATEGYDLSAQAGTDVTLDCIGLARPTQSLVLYLQMIGRGLRPKPDGRPAIILDHAGLTMKFGLADDDREWSLAGVAKPKSAIAALTTRQCPSCFHIHRPSGHCPECGHVYEIVGREVEHVDGELVEFDVKQFRETNVGMFRSMVANGADPVEAARKMATSMGEKPKDLEYLLQQAKQKGYKPTWAMNVFAARIAKQRGEKNVKSRQA